MNVLIFNILLFLSKFPLRFLYALRPILFIIIYHWVQYRKDVVYKNLKNSFPEKSNQEIKSIAKEFYNNFCDFFIEAIWIISATKEDIKKRFVIENIDIVNKYALKKKNVAFLAGHVFNFELAVAYAKDFLQDSIYLVFKKSKSTFWNDKLIKQRSRFGAIVVESDKIMEIADKSTWDGKSIFVLVADQSPKDGKSDLFVDFLNQKTYVYKGFEKIVVRNNLQAFYVDIRKSKDLKYFVKFVPIYPEEEIFKENELTNKFFTLLQESIKKAPANWLWSHKRWKIKPNKN